MAVVIRLQGLSAAAGSEDIRKFFTGLKIPDGGVHIIGGERDEAFIIFSSDEDARRAMTRSLGCIMGSPVTLLLSSKTEMQNMLERSTRSVELDQKRRLEDNARRVRRSVEIVVGRRPVNRLDHSPPPQRQEASSSQADFIHVFLKGLPFSVTKQEIREFFSGLQVDDIILFKNGHGANNGNGLVKFATSRDAHEGLKRDRGYIGSRYIEISPTTEDDWRRAAGKLSMAGNSDKDFPRERSPIRSHTNPQRHARSQSPLAHRSLISTDDEYCVLLDNLPYTVEKEDIKTLFCNANLEDDQILHLLASDGRRTRSTFVLFKSLRDYCDALTNEKRLFENRWVYTRPISREKMISLLQSQGMDDGSPVNSDRFQERPQSYPSDAGPKVCLLVRSLPYDVRKVEIMDFFFGFDITEDNVFVMTDGDGFGKALVLFRSETEAMSALSLNGQRFLGSEVMLKCISQSQMQQFGFEPSMIHERRMQNPLPREELSSSRSSMASFAPVEMEFPDFRNPHVDLPVANVQRHEGYDSEPYTGGPHAPLDRGNGFRGGSGALVQNLDEPTCVQLVNLPFQVKDQEIYDFCYGYRIIPGSVCLQYEPSGRPRGSATAMFRSRQEALTAIKELSGRPIGSRKIRLLM